MAALARALRSNWVVILIFMPCASLTGLPSVQVGNPMSRRDLAGAILGVPSLVSENTEKVPLSLVVIADRGWHVGGNHWRVKKGVKQEVRLYRKLRRHFNNLLHLCNIVCYVVQTHLSQTSNQFSLYSWLNQCASSMALR